MPYSRTCPTPGCPNLRPCPVHDGTHTGRSPNRNRAAQRRFRKAVLARDHYQCIDCGSTHNLRACHILTLAEGGGYHPDGGVTRCANCDKATDPYAR